MTDVHVPANDIKASSAQAKTALDGTEVFIDWSTGLKIPAELLKGEPGDPGSDGAPGVDGPVGLSAYQVWLNNGNTGPETAFLAALGGERGADGEQGVQGETGLEGGTGEQGLQGAAGADGANGESAYQTWLNAGNIGNEQAFLTAIVGEDGNDGADAVLPDTGSQAEMEAGSEVSLRMTSPLLVRQAIDAVTGDIEAALVAINGV